MAQKVTVQLVDDLDGSTGGPDEIETIAFGLDGVTYEIDLNQDNATDLRESLDRFIDSARRTGGRHKRNAYPQSTRPVPGNPITGGSGRSKPELKAVRDWAVGEGMDVADRGRISTAVLKAYDDAHQPESMTGKNGTTGKRGRRNVPATAFTG